MVETKVYAGGFLGVRNLAGHTLGGVLMEASQGWRVAEDPRKHMQGQDSLGKGSKVASHGMAGLGPLCSISREVNVPQVESSSGLALCMLSTVSPFACAPAYEFDRIFSSQLGRIFADGVMKNFFEGMMMMMEPIFSGWNIQQPGGSTALK